MHSRRRRRQISRLLDLANRPQGDEFLDPRKRQQFFRHECVGLIAKQLAQPGLNACPCTIEFDLRVDLTGVDVRGDAAGMRTDRLPERIGRGLGGRCGDDADAGVGSGGGACFPGERVL